MAATAKATVTLEIPINDNWKDDTSLKQVYAQAEDSARQKLRSVVSGGARIVGIKIDAVIYPNTEAIPT